MERNNLRWPRKIVHMSRNLKFVRKSLKASAWQRVSQCERGDPTSQITGKSLQITGKSFFFLSITDTNKWTNVLRMSERVALICCSRSHKALQLFLLWLQLPTMALKHLFFTCDPFRHVSLTILRPVLSGGVWSTWGPFVNTLEGSRHVRSCLKVTGEGRQASPSFHSFLSFSF